MRLTENSKELNRHIISAFIANYVMHVQRQTGRSLEDLLSEIGVPFVWTPVGNKDGEIKIIASILVFASDRKTILVHSLNTEPTPIKEVPYIFTEFSEVSHFLSERNLIPEYSDEDEISDVPEGEQVVYLPNIDDIFEDDDDDDDEIEVEVEVEIVMVVIIKLLARLIAKM